MVLSLSKDKGVSEIIATVLMIMIVTVLGFSMFIYGLGFFTASTSAYNQATDVGIQSLNERFVIVNANFTCTGGPTNGVYTPPVNVTVWVYNYGRTNLNIKGMYLNGTLLNIIAPPEPIMIYSNQVVQITGNYTTSTIWTNSTQEIKIVSSLGNYYENYFMPK